MMPMFSTLVTKLEVFTQIKWMLTYNFQIVSEYFFYLVKWTLSLALATKMVVTVNQIEM